MTLTPAEELELDAYCAAYEARNAPEWSVEQRAAYWTPERKAENRAFWLRTIEAREFIAQQVHDYVGAMEGRKNSC